MVLEEPPQIREKEFNLSVKQHPTCPWEVTEEDVDRIDRVPLNPPPDRYFKDS